MTHSFTVYGCRPDRRFLGETSCLIEAERYARHSLSWKGCDMGGVNAWRYQSAEVWTDSSEKYPIGQCLLTIIRTGKKGFGRNVRRMEVRDIEEEGVTHE